MKKQTKVQGITWFKGFLLSLFLLSGASGFSNTPDLRPLSCIIENLQRTGPSQGTVYYSWSTVSGATAYKVYYVRLSDGYTSQVYTTGSPAYSFPGLSAGTYRCYFAPVCGDGTLEYVTDDLIIL